MPTISGACVCAHACVVHVTHSLSLFLCLCVCVCVCLFLFPFLFLPVSLSHSHSLTHQPTHTHTQTQTHSLTRSHPLTHSLSLTLSHTGTTTEQRENGPITLRIPASRSSTPRPLATRPDTGAHRYRMCSHTTECVPLECVPLLKCVLSALLLADLAESPKRNPYKLNPKH